MNASDTPDDPTPTPDSWSTTLEELRTRYPGQKDSVLFCVHKLQQDPAVGLPDLRDEATDRGIPMAGRALHSAKVLLGMAEARPRRPAEPRDERATAGQRASRAGARAERSRSERGRSDEPAGAIEDQVLAAVRQIQSAAGAEAERMRTAIRQAIAILQDALEE